MVLKGEIVVTCFGSIQKSFVVIIKAFACAVTANGTFQIFRQDRQALFWRGGGGREGRGGRGTAFYTIWNMTGLPVLTKILHPGFLGIFYKCSPKSL